VEYWEVGVVGEFGGFWIFGGFCQLLIGLCWVCWVMVSGPKLLPSFVRSAEYSLISLFWL
jgi:hypothetical protein